MSKPITNISYQAIPGIPRTPRPKPSMQEYHGSCPWHYGAVKEEGVYEAFPMSCESEHKRIRDRVFPWDGPNELVAFIEDLIINRFFNKENFTDISGPLPKANKALVVMSGPSLNKETINLIKWDDYDLIFLGKELVKSLSWDNPKIWVVDMDYMLNPFQFYLAPDLPDVNLVTCWEKFLHPSWKIYIKKIFYTPPPANFDWMSRERSCFGRQPDSSKGCYCGSTGGLAMQVALDNCGGSTQVDVIGIDLTHPDYKRFHGEMAWLLVTHPGRVRFLAGGELFRTFIDGKSTASICKRCKGKGQLGEIPKTCKICDGSGVITKKVE